MNMNMNIDLKNNAGPITEINAAAFDAEVLGAAMPVLVDFFTHECRPCRQAKALLEAIAPEFAGRVKFIQLNAQAEPELATRYRVVHVPTLMVFVRGEPVESHVGTPSLKRLRTMLEEAAEAAPTKKSQPLAFG
jgi:thioredoxin 1